MKKILLTMTLATVAFGSVMAQQQIKPGSWKAFDKISKGDAKMQERNSDAFNAGMALYKEAEAILQADIDKQKASPEPKFDKLAQLYHQSAGLQNKFLGPVMGLASAGEAFDTLAFCNYVDRIISDFNTSAAYNLKPNAKGKVKTDQAIQMANKLGISSMLNYYYNCGAFMDAMGKKQESVDFFQKFVDLPGNSPVFTKAEADSIYKGNQKLYSVARFNLALQNFYLKNWDKAVACADEALKDTVGTHDLYLIKINALGEKKDSVAWQHALIEAAQKTGSSSFLQNLMYYYIQNNKIEDATALANKLVVDDPNNKMTWFMKGAIELNVKKDYTSARESFGKALAIDPDFQDALFNMGTAYINDIYEQRMDGKFKYIGTNRRIEGKGEAAYKKEKAIYDKEVATVRSYYEKAKPYLEHLRELAPDNAKLWAPSLQMVYSSLGDKDNAKLMDDLLDAANKAAQ